VFEVRKEILDSHEVLLEVVFEPETVEEAKREAAREISREVNIPGFRKGKAPYGKVIQYVGEPTVVQEAAEHLLQEHYPEFLEKAEISPYGPGDLEAMETSPLTFKLRVPLEPEVDLGDYRSLRETWTEPSVSEEELQQVLEQAREENAILEPIEGPAELGNELRISVHATVEGDVVVDEHDVPVVLSLTRPFLSPEFVEALVGVTTGEERTFTLALPETIEEPSLRGEDAEFEIQVEQVYERQLPDLDDALASTVGSFETLDALVGDIRTRILTRKRQQSETGYQETLIDKLVEQAEMSYPPQLIEDTLDDMVASITERVQQQQKMSLEDALRLQGQTLEQYREELRPQAEARAREMLAMRELAVAEQIEVSSDEVAQEYANLLNQFGMAEQLKDMSLTADHPLAGSLRGQVFERKVRNRLAAIARGELDEGEEEPVVMFVADDVEVVEADTEVVADDVITGEMDSGEAADNAPVVDEPGDEDNETEGTAGE
jgi:trigger factor